MKIRYIQSGEDWKAAFPPARSIALQSGGGGGGAHLNIDWGCTLYVQF